MSAQQISIDVKPQFHAALPAVARDIEKFYSFVSAEAAAGTLTLRSPNHSQSALRRIFAAALANNTLTDANAVNRADVWERLLR